MCVCVCVLFWLFFHVCVFFSIYFQYIMHNRYKWIKKTHEKLYDTYYAGEYKWVNLLMDGWMDGWMDGQMDRWMDGWADR